MKTASFATFAATAVFAASTFAPVQLLQAQQATAGQALAKEAVLCSLTTKLDTKKSKAGDPVAAKTLNPLTLNDGTIVPSGSKITGKLTQAQSKASGGATLAIEFDQLEKKGGAPVPVHGLIAGIAPLPDLGGGGGAANNDLPMRGTAAQNAAQTGVSMGPGGGSETPIAAGSSIKGVTLSPVPAADGAAVLQSPDKDFKLESGTRLEIGLTAAK
jgi:hypothetical protein